MIIKRLSLKNHLVLASNNHDEYYRYDGIFRVNDLERGTLNGSQTGISALTFAECWSLDANGNWAGYRKDDEGDNLWDLVQDRTSNPANEITLVTADVGPIWSTPVYDRAGNMVSMPQPASPTDSFAATFDAWNRLVKLEADNEALTAFKYDGLVRRTVQMACGGGFLEEPRHYFYSSEWQVLEGRVAVASGFYVAFLKSRRVRGLSLVLFRGCGS